MKRARSIFVVSYFRDNSEPARWHSLFLEAESRDTTRAEELTGMIGECYLKAFGVMVLPSEDDRVFLTTADEELPVLLRNETQVTGAEVMSGWTGTVRETRVKGGLGEGDLFEVTDGLALMAVPDFCPLGLEA